MKKTLAFVLLAVMMLGIFSSCGGNGAASGTTPSGGSAASAGGDGERTLYLAGHARMYPGEEEAWQAAADAFEAENPGVKVIINWQGQWDQVPENLNAMKLAGEKPDLYSAGAGVLRQSLLQAGLAMDMTELMKPYMDRFIPGGTDSTTIGGRLWNVPIASSGSCTFYYNAAIFEEMELEEPTTFDELVDVVNTIKAKRPDLIPILQHGKNASYWPMWFMETYAQSSGNTSVANVIEWMEGKRDFNGPEEIEGFELLKKFRDEGLISDESFDTDNEGMKAAFAQEKCVMFYGGTWEYTSASAAVDGAFEIGVFEFPIMLEGVKSQHGGGGGTGVFIPTFADRNNVDLTMKFVELITRPEFAAAIIEPASPIIPTVEGVPPGDDPFVEKINEVHKQNTIPFLDWIWPAEINDAFMQAIPAVMSGNMTPEDAANSVQAMYETIVEEKAYKYDWWSDWADEDWALVTPEFIPESYA